MRIIAWNILAGGGARAEAIAAQLALWSPDIVCLCEFRATPPSRAISESLAACGLEHQLSTAKPDIPSANALLIASRLPLRPLTIRNAPASPRRWLAAAVQAEAPFVLGAMHLPNMVTGLKLPFMAALEAMTRQWRRGPALLIGDTNCGWPDLDEERPVFGPQVARWLDELAKRGWRDAYRCLHPEERFYTWYSPNGGNGFRLDQAFVNRGLQPRLRRSWYEWGGDGSTRRALSDHAALLLDLD